jgi:predicted transcriptional regulator
VARGDAGRTALGRIVDKVFHGSTEMALARLVEERAISKDELDRMRRILDELARQDERQEGER